ncbi:hypothetical protein ACFV1N_39535 [Streptosporangium canum]|uniref:hypothetical protein n=1 Tax=Streptosporangium canum TaxID=324952 RepID=UPI00367CDCAE
MGGDHGLRGSVPALGSTASGIGGAVATPLIPVDCGISGRGRRRGTPRITLSMMLGSPLDPSWGGGRGKAM